MDNFIVTLQSMLLEMKNNLPILGGILAVLWGIHLINWMSKYRLNQLGIVPRTIRGLFGIVFSPFLHGHFDHLFFNSIPLIVLASSILLFGYPVFICVTVLIILIEGLLVWLFARRAIHIGASGVIMGYFSFLLINAIQSPSAFSIILAFIALYYFSGLLFNLFPSDIKTSWEGHVFGFIAGIAATFLMPMILTSQYFSV